MELTVKRVSSLAFLVMFVALAPRARPFRATATSLLENNGTTNSSCYGGMAKCLIVDEDLDLQIMTGFGISRMLAGKDPYKTTGTKSASVVPCDRGNGQPYHTCAGDDHKHKIPESCGVYKRAGCT
ncbi:hypothetical protein CJ030_MR2G012409 [Morella rubra]|uniref:Uncharacterized protein n=1 Tax=Morella rubra TaxID=262757 RepID=A0A6A1WDN7_9ROSI|nr:hypothetical protein CJ030_MR2G012409 [Morella rubra]